jgi:hypothetical protein
MYKSKLTFLALVTLSIVTLQACGKFVGGNVLVRGSEPTPQPNTPKQEEPPTSREITDPTITIKDLCEALKQGATVTEEIAKSIAANANKEIKLNDLRKLKVHFKAGKLPKEAYM